MDSSIIIILSLVTTHSPWYKQRCHPPLRLQVSDSSNFRKMCDISNYTCLCSEPTEYFSCMDHKYFFKPFVKIPVSPIITCTIIHSMFHFRCIYMHKFLYLLSLLPPLHDISVLWYCYMYQ